MMQPSYQITLQRKTRRLVWRAILSNTAGNLLLAQGMRDVAELGPHSAFGYLSVFLNPWVDAGVLLLLFWLTSQLALLSWADLSYVLQVTSAAYILTAVAGKLLLNEQVSMARWFGIGLISAGVAVAGRSSPRTTPPSKPEDGIC